MTAIDPTPLPRRRHTRRTISAAATRLDDLANGRGEVHRQLARTEKWQELSLGFYDTVGEVHYAVTTGADALAKGRLFVGIRPTANDDLLPVDDPDSGVPPSSAKLAMDKLAELKAPVGGQAAIIRMAAMNRDLTGEWYLLHYQGENEALWGWHVRSVEDIRVESNKVTSQGLGEFTLDEVSRVWNPHPRRFEAADCGMRGVLSQCETVLLIDRKFRAALRSRLFAGLLLLSNEFRQGPDNDATADAGDGEATDDPVIADILTALSLGIQDEGSASAVVPNTLWGSTDAVERGARLLNFAQAIDAEDLALRDSSLRRVVQGLDCPPGVVLGVEDANHWSAWFVGESFVQHVEPKATFLVDAFTQVFLHPELEGQIDPDLLDRLEVGIDLSALMRRPNGDQDARDAYDRGELNGEGLRKALGISEQYAPDEMDTIRWLILNKAQFGPALTAALVRLGLIPDLPADVGITPAPGAPADGTAPATAPADGVPADGAPPQDTTPIAAAVLASAVLNAIDRRLTERLFGASLAAFRRALERAGNRARRRVAAAHRPRAEDVPAHQVIQHVGPTLLAAAGLTDEELLAGSLDDLRGDFDRWVTEAQAQALAAAIAMAPNDPEPEQIDEFTQQQESDRDDAWLWFAAAAALLLQERMVDGQPVKDWEVRSLVRQSLARAGGATELAPIDDSGQIPEGAGAGMATGVAILGLLGALGVHAVSWEWVHGEPDHPFPDHVDLNGRVEASQDDFDGNYPGDHDGCTCELQPVFETSDDSE